MPGHRRHLTSLRNWDAGFDGGSVLSVTQEGGSVRITPQLGYDSKWAQFAVRFDRLAGQTPHFLIAHADRFAAPAENENMAVWATSPDTDSWTMFNNQAVGASDIEVYNDAPFPNGTIYVAHVPLFPFSRVGRVFREWIKDTRVTLKYAGQATRRAAANGRSAPGLPFYGLLLTNTSGFTKNNMVLCAMSHGNEMQGAYQLEGAMSWLLAGSPEAEFLLDWFNVFVYPCTNPQGVWAGYHRSQPEDITKDHNRFWDVDTLECIAAFRAAINTDTGGVVDVGFDFHGSVGASKIYGMITDNTTALAVAYEAEMDVYVPDYFDNASDIAESCKAYLESLGADLANGQEGALHNTYGPAQWKLGGQYAMRSITNMHADGRWTNGPGVGSRDFNGSSNRIDWASIATLTGSPITISAWIYSAYSAGTDYIFMTHQAGDAATGFIVYQTSTTKISLSRSGTTVLFRTVDAPSTLVGAWHHVLATHDGTFNDYTTVHVYIDGTEGTHFNGANGASENAVAGSWAIGGRIFDDARNFEGKIAQVGVWSRVLTAGEIANLAAGYAPDLAAPTDLEFYFKGNTASLDDEITSAEGTADGTSSVTGVGNGPGIIYG